MGIYAQETLTGEIFVDNFAGGGGASTGLELALSVVIAVAINHDPAAILMHKTNHPYTEHLQASVWDIDPRAVCRGRPVAGAWFSPDCKHFSKAKGAALVDKKIRGLAWITLRWAGTVRPRVIFLENVEEFKTWGPVRRGKPIKRKAGQTFDKFVGQLEGLGYAVEWRELVAADFGAPTTRKRFVLIARCDGQPIVWPEPAHARADSPEVKTGAKKAWRSAAEIIDWELPCPSIFATREEIKATYGLNSQRPLRPNTLRRVIRGVDKYTIRSGAPFLVPVGYGERNGQAPRVHSIDSPLATVVGKNKHTLCTPLLSPITISNTGHSVGGDAGRPIHTVRTGGGGQVLITPSLIQYHTEQTEHVRAAGLTGPINTIDASNRYGLTAASLIKYYGSEQDGQDITGPLHTVTVKDRAGLTAVSLSKFYGGVIGADVKSPLPTVTSVDHNALAAAHLVKMKGDNLGSQAAMPVQTITAGGGHFGVVTTTITQISPGADLRHWAEIRDLLNEYCGYYMREDELLLIWIGGTAYYIADIGLRMLSPRELYKAMGFPEDYIIDRDHTGKPYPKAEQVARCGNAVCPPLAAAVARANFPDYAERVGETITTMAGLMSAVAV